MIPLQSLLNSLQAWAQEELSCSPVWACATPTPVITAQMAVNMRVLRAITDVFGLQLLPLERRLPSPPEKLPKFAW